jgi:hypothetical protein
MHSPFEREKIETPRLFHGDYSSMKYLELP